MNTDATFDFSQMIAEAERQVNRPDVLTVAQAMRGGSQDLHIRSVSNGFIVEVGVFDTLVIQKSDDLGRLLHTLFTSNLDIEDNVKRLRRLMGYK